jgi:CheY-like chemotaxis protein
VNTGDNQPANGGPDANTAGWISSALRNRVLIVDDEEGIRELFCMIIAQDLPGVELDEARNGFEALEQFQRHRAGVLVMDLHMPVMDGLTAFGRIRQICEDWACQMPAVIFCSGFAPPSGVREIVRNSGRHSLLAKPVKSEVLVKAVRVRLPDEQPFGGHGVA